ncbi:MAG: FtsX-like permease family protein [Gracilibacteraceae bacterium]|jgi:putative ABC transport system permease protein|nr:FtsX-like permease family protein [Gracilibacteraceae bacterium]
MNSAELALRNVRKSLRDYAIYFMTMTIGICIFYVFNSLGSQQAVMELSGAQSLTMRMLDRLVGGFSLFISLILCFLIIYANGFLIKRRKKEFGLYLTLGMERGQIARILALETLFMSLAALVAGLLLGALLAQGMALVTASLLGVKIGGFHFIFSLAAAGKTVVYFGLAFGLTLFFNMWQLKRQHLIDLLYAGRQNERSRAPHPPVAAALFLLSLLILAAAYLITAARLYQSPLLLYALLALGAVGTFLFFFSLAGFLFTALRRTKLYLRDLNMFVLRQLSSKINTAYVSIALVCLMLFLSICSLSSGLGLARAINEDLRANAPYDATLILRSKNGGPFAPAGLPAAAEENGANLAGFAAASGAAVFREAADLNLNFTAGREKASLYLLGLTEYNAALALQGAPPVTLPPDKYALNIGASGADWDKALGQFTAGGGEITLGGRSLSTESALWRHYVLEVSTRSNTDIVVVAADELVAGRPALKEVLFINYPQPDLTYEQKCLAALSEPDIRAADGAELSALVETRIQVADYTGNSTATIGYLAIYMGAVFLLASATVLAIGQLSEASDNIRRYRLLSQLGADAKMLQQALFRQILIYFGAPLLLALVHSAVGIKAAGAIMLKVGGFHILGASIVSALIMVLVYGGYFFATYRGGKNMVGL